MSVTVQQLTEVAPQPAAVSNSDFTAAPVPLAERRSSTTMGLLWITMVTGFPSVLVGFQWFREGLSLTQVILCSLLSCGLLMAYCLPSCMLGSKSGLTYALLGRKVFGRFGSWLVSLNLMWVSIAWYGLTAVFLADGLEGLYHWHFSPVWFSAVLAFAMAFNNFFGFSGVANFARYLAGPVLVAWVGFTFWKAGLSCPPTVWTEPGHISMPAALGLVSSFVIGYSVWGNEADYWRFGKPKLLHVMAPIMVAIAIGEFLFPITGWMLARSTGITSTAAATSLMNSYAFGGWSIVAAAVLIVTYVACNDSSLYGAINALQNIYPVPRKRMVASLSVVGAITAAILAGVANNFEQVAALSCIFLPCATLVIVAEHWLVRKWQCHPLELSHSPHPDQLPHVRWSAVIAFAAGCVVGTITTGIIPGTQNWRVGVPALQAWIVSLCVYLAIRYAQLRNEKRVYEN